MSLPRLYTETEPLDPKADLHSVLDAWHNATLRLEQTHENLRQEVRRLSGELETKNRELAHQNRLADLGQMTAHVADELRNRLESVALCLSLLQHRLAGESLHRELLDKLAVSVTSIDTTVSDLLYFTTQREPLRRPVELRHMIEEILQSVGPQLESQHVQVDLDVPFVHQLFADREMLRRCILNLMLNAIDAMPKGGHLVITSYSGPHGFELEIADSGPGLSDEVRRRMFEPFFTTKNSSSGLGLAIVSRIAEAHGGDLTARNCPEGGAAFTLRIAVNQHALQAAA
ncbi:MAG TPA: ATP-binding protein [Pirellulales bacterium]|jgi:signal transduction histidine kinase